MIRRGVSILIVLAVVSSTSARAWEMPRNPDRFISLGFNASATDLSGHRTESDLPPNPVTQRVQSGAEKGTSATVGADIRFPATDSLTLGLSYDQVQTDGYFTRAGGTYKEDSTLSGYRVGFTARLYLNK